MRANIDMSQVLAERPPVPVLRVPPRAPSPADLGMVKLRCAYDKRPYFVSAAAGPGYCGPACAAAALRREARHGGGQ